ncbi:MAG: 50S ribosomal protein L35 [Candidatus Omnitrophica bacterium CG1_02_49_10]|nr:MAG: 50S ribosomal protein L35 [Candidatus Omnitrophica bacterium CG1_02_49_10]
MKLKTRKSVAKRFRLTGKGKLKRKKAYKGHLLQSKSRKRKRHLRKPALVDSGQLGTLKKLLPYG